MAFYSWLTNRLNEKGIDGDVYAEYIKQVIDEGDIDDDALEMSLGDIIGGLFDHKGDSARFVKDILYYYKNPGEIVLPTVDDVNSCTKLQDEVVVETSADVEVNEASQCQANNFDEIVQESCYPTDSTAIDFDEEFESFDEPAWSDSSFLSQAYELEENLKYYHGTDTLIYSPHSMYSAIFLSCGNVEFAMKILLVEAHRSMNCKPCRHYISNYSCLMRDCKFEHNLRDYTCQYWLTTGCKFDIESCPFLHDFNLNTHLTEEFQLNSQHTQKTHEAQLSLSEFPELAPSKVSSPNAPKAVIEEPLIKFNYSRNIINQSQYENSELNKNKSNNMKSPYAGAAASIVFGATEWTESGSSVAEDYSKFRSEAREVAIKRNKLLEEATNAYLKGSAALAKNLSAAGQELNRQMKELHLKAASNIFWSRNSKNTIMSRGVVDLHGLHVAEAKELLLDLLPLLPQNGLGEVKIVTGTGHHTLGPQKAKPRLLPVVEAVCNDYGLKFGYVKDPNGYIGAVKIALR